MNKVLILYPALFNCYAKFNRKVSKIVSNLNNASVVFIEDGNNFIKDICSEQKMEACSAQSLDECVDTITHAIVFDDGEEFVRERQILESMKIPLRVIAIKVTRVINIKNETEYQNQKSTEQYEYIGRGSRWGNPYSIFEIEDIEDDESPRDRVINNFKYDFDHDKLFNLKKSEVFKLAGKRLGCFCKPLACHGDVIADYLNSWDDGN